MYLGAGVWSSLGSSGASSAGLGGKGGCGSYLTCRLKRELPYGDLYVPTDYGSGGALYNGGSGKSLLWQTVVVGLINNRHKMLTWLVRPRKRPFICFRLYQWVRCSQGSLLSESIFVAGVKCRVTAVKRVLILHCSADYIILYTAKR